MKLVISVVSNQDADKVISALGAKGYYVTKIATKGQFLVDGNTSILSVCHDEEVPDIYVKLAGSQSEAFQSLVEKIDNR